ncbi:uncharacterized protein LOC114294255 [Camellia sinensis]|uniref:uncharacterized protein LOC114294255 n=1 Tax=Camellia sinensis TaxID=4442 RepID=UPI0010362475|nr:uncharacterized protein LOC114294255 [Camellia sinensis]
MAGLSLTQLAKKANAERMAARRKAEAIRPGVPPATETQPSLPVSESQPALPVIEEGTAEIQSAEAELVVQADRETKERAGKRSAEVEAGSKVRRITEMGRRYRDAIEQLGRLQTEVEGQRSRAEFKALRSKMEGARVESKMERARNTEQLRLAAERRADASEGVLKLAQEAVSKLEAELEEAKKAKEAADSKASKALQAEKSAALAKYISECQMEFSSISKGEARTLAKLDAAMNRSREPTRARGRAFKEWEKGQPLSRRSRSPLREKQQRGSSPQPRPRNEADVASRPLSFTIFAGNSFLVRDLGFDVVYGVKALHLEGDCLASVNVVDLSMVRSKHFKLRMLSEQRALIRRCRCTNATSSSPSMLRG